ncbi:hypothetical protein D3C86_1472200 [compost metagenome]
MVMARHGTSARPASSSSAAWEAEPVARARQAKSSAAPASETSSPTARPSPRRLAMSAGRSLSGSVKWVAAPRRRGKSRTGLSSTSMVSLVN